MVPICRPSLPEKTFRRYFGRITTWYVQSQRTWEKLCHSCRGSSFLPRGAFPEGRASAFPQRLHAGSLEALRVSRPEAVVLAINNYFPRWSSSSWSIVNHRGAPLSIWNIVNRKAPDAEAPWNIVNQHVALAGWNIVSWGKRRVAAGPCPGTS